MAHRGKFQWPDEPEKSVTGGLIFGEIGMRIDDDRWEPDEFDLIQFCTRRGIKVRSRPFHDYTRHYFEKCPELDNVIRAYIRKEKRRIRRAS